MLARPGKDLKEVEKAVYAEMERAKGRTHRRLGTAESPHDGAALKPRSNCRARCIAPILIGEMAVIFGDPNLINTRFDKIQNVGKEDIQRVAKTYLTEENRTVVTTLPKPKAETALQAAN